jgi:hypothetical protein
MFDVMLMSRCRDSELHHFLVISWNLPASALRDFA